MRIIRGNRITEKTGFTYRWCKELEKAGAFPKRVKLGPRAVGWLESEVDEWLRRRAEERVWNAN